MTRFKSVALTMPLLFAVCGCGQREAAESRNEANQIDAAESAAPNISLTAAPGVAFSYEYRFGLESSKIATL